MRKLAIIFALSTSPLMAQDVADGPGPNLVIEIAGETSGTVVIDLLEDIAPEHVAQIVVLTMGVAYDTHRLSNFYQIWFFFKYICCHLAYFLSLIL